MIYVVASNIKQARGHFRDKVTSQLRLITRPDQIKGLRKIVIHVLPGAKDFDVHEILQIAASQECEIKYL